MAKKKVKVTKTDLKDMATYARESAIKLRYSCDEFVGRYDQALEELVAMFKTSKPKGISETQKAGELLRQKKLLAEQKSLIVTNIAPFANRIIAAADLTLKNADQVSAVLKIEDKKVKNKTEKIDV